MTDSTPLVSVIVTCYNYGKFLTEALESVMAQTYSNWECIVIDDGSKDDSAVITKKFVDRDERIRYVYQQNQGISAARNAGIAIAQGEYIQFLDADDILPKNKLMSQVSVLTERPEVDVVFGDTSFFHTDTPGSFVDGREGKRSKGSQLKTSGMGEDMVRRFSINNFIETSAALIRRSLVDRVGEFITQYKVYEDWHFWFRCAISNANFLYHHKDGAALYSRYGHTSLMTNTKQLVLDGIRIRSYMQRFLPIHLKAYNSYRLAKLLIKRAML
jgi:glycosyltransferase involved in cell wall biosynthesis